MPIKNFKPNWSNAFKAAAGVAGAITTILGLWWGMMAQIESIIDKKNKEVLVEIDHRFVESNVKMQDNTAVVLGVLANDYRDRLTLVNYEIEQKKEHGEAVPFSLYTQQKQLEDNIEKLKKWQD